MTAEQLALFEPAPEPAGGPADVFTLIPCCHLCGAHGTPVPVEGGHAAPWHAAACWTYVALRAHIRQQHPEHYMTGETTDADH